MARRRFLPAGFRFARELGESAHSAGECGEIQRETLTTLASHLSTVDDRARALEAALRETLAEADGVARAIQCRDQVLPVLEQLRVAVDAVEAMSPADLWPVPTYTDLLFKL